MKSNKYNLNVKKLNIFLKTWFQHNISLKIEFLLTEYIN